MGARIFRDALILLAIFGGMWYFFFKVDVLPSFGGGRTIPISYEKELGDALLDEYLTSQKKVTDEVVLDAIQQIQDRLLGTLDTTEYTYTIVVVKSDELNAFATLGGNIVVFTGLMDLAGSPEELASVLAHEIGHVEKQHVVDKLVAELGLTALLAIISNGDPMVIQNVLQMIVSNSFSRSQEKDADKFAFNMLDDAGIDPANFGVLFERMEDEHEAYPEEFELIMTHPHSDHRIDAAYKYAEEHHIQKRPFDDIDWDAVKAAIQ